MRTAWAVRQKHNGVSIRTRPRTLNARPLSSPSRSARCLLGRLVDRFGMARAAADDGVAWQPAANNGDIDRAFAQARSESKPVLLYWGAKWCPPCNQLKATLFNRHDFIERSKSLVAVEIDGDLPGAQKLGARFKVSGYPTMVLMRTDGAELMRLPGEADAPQVLQLLEFGLAGGRAAKDVLADARAGKPLPGAEWRMLAFYSWISDESQLLAAAERPGSAGRPVGRLPAQRGGQRDPLDAQGAGRQRRRQGREGRRGVAPACARLARRPGAGARADGRADQLCGRDHQGGIGVGQRRSQGDRDHVRQRAAAAASRRHAVARRPPQCARCAGGSGSHRRREERAPSAHRGAAAAAGARCQRAGRSRSDRRLRTPGGDHGGGVRPRPGRAVEGVRLRC